MTDTNGTELRRTLGLLTEADLMSALSVSQATLQEWRMKGLGPDFAKLGKQVFYREIDVNAWINNSIFTSTVAKAA